ncbi:hypothetical protein TDB9533_01663 [Thalassocella blandensis]|nr:hypothetical protein TDB9533_01663 [Thalassocella blandensis]
MPKTDQTNISLVHVSCDRLRRFPDLKKMANFTGKNQFFYPAALYILPRVPVYLGP